MNNVSPENSAGFSVCERKAAAKLAKVAEERQHQRSAQA